MVFEVATDGPGFTRGESIADLGHSLQLPPWLEENREYLDRTLPDLAVRAGREGGSRSRPTGEED